ncbi:MAG: DUF1295 domain-containing protein [Pseudomonadota bacterium]
MTERTPPQVIIGLIIAIGLGAFIAWAGSQGGERFDGMPIFALCAAWAFLVNWLVFVPSAIAQTEKFYDLTGGIAYVTTVVIAVYLSSSLDLRATLVAAMVVFWALRLSTFLFLRIRAAGHDSRFDTIKVWPLRFFFAWTLQGLWVILTASAALVVITGGNRVPLDAFAVVGILVWLLGITFEVIADRQKSKFKADSNNDGTFITTGLWAWSRHPNYFGEIVLWLGIAIIAIPVLQGWQWVSMISPVFVFVLLTRVSGVNMLEEKSDQRWGAQPAYEKYKKNTPVLFPRPPSKTND